MKKDITIIGSGILALILSVIFMTKDMIHVVFEAIAVPFGAYFIWYGITRAEGFHKYIFIIFGAGNIIIDGYLLLKNYAGMF